MWAAPDSPPECCSAEPSPQAPAGDGSSSSTFPWESCSWTRSQPSSRRPRTWQRGGYYLLRMSEALHTPAAILVALVVVIVLRGEVALRRAAIYVLLVTGVFYVYIASVGGDFMGLFRFAMPVVPLLFALMAASLAAKSTVSSMKSWMPPPLPFD